MEDPGGPCVRPSSVPLFLQLAQLHWAQVWFWITINSYLRAYFFTYGNIALEKREF